MLIIQALGEVKQEDHEFEDSLDYIVRLPPKCVETELRKPSMGLVVTMS